MWDTVGLSAHHTDGNLEAGGETDIGHGTAKITDTELVGDGLPRASNTQQLKAISTPANSVLLLVDNEAESIDDGTGALSDGNVVNKGKVVVDDGLGGGQAGVHGVDFGVGEGEAEIPSVSQIDTTKEALAVEGILSVAKGAGDGAGWVACGKAHGSLQLPGAVEGERVDGVGSQDHGRRSVSGDDIADDSAGIGTRKGSPLAKRNSIEGRLIVIDCKGLKDCRLVGGPALSLTRSLLISNNRRRGSG